MGRVFYAGGKVDMKKPVALPAVGTALNDCSWEQIKLVCDAGLAANYFAVGDQKIINIGGNDYAFDIIGMNHDDYADSSGKSPITFQMHDCYGTAYTFHSNQTNSVGWTGSVMRSTHLPGILALMPSEVQAAIKEVTKLTSAGSGTTTINTTADKLFLLSEIEIVGSASYSVAGEGTQYDYYAAGNSKIKYLSGTANMWWTRSPRKSNASYFCGVNTSGSVTHCNTTVAYGVAFAFCV